MTPTSLRRLFWGGTIFTAGIILLLQGLGVLPGEAWMIIWPIFVIIIGLELIVTSVYKPGEEIEIEIPKFWFKKRVVKKAKTAKKKK